MYPGGSSRAAEALELRSSTTTFVHISTGTRDITSLGAFILVVFVVGSRLDVEDVEWQSAKVSMKKNVIQCALWKPK